jgi:hypothetical protein
MNKTEQVELMVLFRRLKECRKKDKPTTLLPYELELIKKAVDELCVDVTPKISLYDKNTTLIEVDALSELDKKPLIYRLKENALVFSKTYVGELCGEAANKLEELQRQLYDTRSESKKED